MLLRGTVKNGVVIPETAGALREGAQVRIQTTRSRRSPTAAEPAPKKRAGRAAAAKSRAKSRRPRTLLDEVRRFVGVFDDMPEDSSRHIDHYLYGTPKR